MCVCVCVCEKVSGRGQGCSPYRLVSSPHRVIGELSRFKTEGLRPSLRGLDLELDSTKVVSTTALAMHV